MIRVEFYRILLIIVIFLNWDIKQVDINTAFLYRDIDSEIYVEILNGFFTNLPDGKIMVYRLFKSFYGFK